MLVLFGFYFGGFDSNSGSGDLVNEVGRVEE